MTVNLTNPVCEREKQTAWRSIRPVLVMTGFNAAAALTAILFGGLSLRNGAGRGVVPYESFPALFRYLCFAEYGLMLVLISVLTGGSIAGERERKTLDLTLITPMTPLAIISGKLMAAMERAVLTVLSAAPLFALSLSIGGIGLKELAVVFLMYLSSAALAGSIGMLCSSAAKGVSSAISASLSSVLLLFLGPLFVIRALGGSGRGILGNLVFLSPAAAFLAVLRDATGEGELLPFFAAGFTAHAGHGSFLRTGVMLILFQAAAAAGLLFLAAMRLE